MLGEHTENVPRVFPSGSINSDQIGKLCRYSIYVIRIRNRASRFAIVEYNYNISNLLKFNFLTTEFHMRRIRNTNLFEKIVFNLDTRVRVLQM